MEVVGLIALLKEFYLPDAFIPRNKKPTSTIFFGNPASCIVAPQNSSPVAGMDLLTQVVRVRSCDVVLTLLS